MVDFEEREKELEEQQAEQQSEKKKKLGEIVDKITDIAMKERRKNIIDNPRAGSPRRMREDPTTPLIREVPFGADTTSIEAPEQGDPRNFDFISNSGMADFDKFEAEQNELPEDEQFPKFGDVTGKGEKMVMDTTKGKEVDANSFRVIRSGGISIPKEQKRIVRPMEKRNFDNPRLKARSNRTQQRDEDAKEIALDIMNDEKPSRFVNRKTKKIRPNKPVRSDFASIISAKNGFRGTVDMKTLFTVGEGNKKEHVTRKKSINVFDIDMFNNKPKKSKRKSNNIFDFMGGMKFK